MARPWQGICGKMDACDISSYVIEEMTELGSYSKGTVHTKNTLKLVGAFPFIPRLDVHDLKNSVLCTED